MCAMPAASQLRHGRMVTRTTSPGLVESGTHTIQTTTDLLAASETMSRICVWTVVSNSTLIRGR
jgi:hypothetical protein